MDRCPAMEYDVQPRSRCPVATPVDGRCRRPTPDDGGDLHACERVVVMFVQLKNYLGTYWLAPWFFVYIYPSVLVYE